MTPAKGVTIDNINKFKSDLILQLIVGLKKVDWQNISESTCHEFGVLAKMCSDNSTSLKDDIKAQYVELLVKFIGNIVS